MNRRALTPLFHGHINPYGQFALDPESAVIPQGSLNGLLQAMKELSGSGDLLRAIAASLV
jgi:hypothetical protein